MDRCKYALIMTRNESGLLAEDLKTTVLECPAPPLGGTVGCAAGASESRRA